MGLVWRFKPDARESRFRGDDGEGQLVHDWEWMVHRIAQKEGISKKKKSLHSRMEIVLTFSRQRSGFSHS